MNEPVKEMTAAGAPVPTRSARLAAAYRDRYRDFQYAYVQFFTEHLMDCSRHFGGDLQKLLVLAIIGQTALNRMRAMDARVGAVTTADVGEISASRLSDVTGIPRQTVRRKLSALSDDGWIERTDNGSWRLRLVGGSAQARIDLSALDNRAVDRVARLVSTLAALER